MMKAANKGEKVLHLLRVSFGTLLEHKIILFPFFIIGAIQLFILEVLYFYPRYPLVKIFGPIVKRVWSETFLHYPHNFSLLPKLFQHIQMPVYIVINIYLIAVGVNIVQKINDGQKFRLKAVFKETLSSYIHILMTGLVSFSLILLFFKGYGLVYQRAIEIRSTEGPFYMMKLAALHSAPYLNMIWSVLVTTLFAYMLPIIVVDKKKFFSALKCNFQFLSGSFCKTFLIVLLPSLLFLPVMWLRNIFNIETFVPELSVVILIGSVIVTILIDVMVYTALTIRYLWKKEEK